MVPAVLALARRAAAGKRGLGLKCDMRGVWDNDNAICIVRKCT